MIIPTKVPNTAYHKSVHKELSAAGYALRPGLVEYSEYSYYPHSKTKTHHGYCDNSCCSSYAYYMKPTKTRHYAYCMDCAYQNITYKDLRNRFLENYGAIPTFKEDRSYTMEELADFLQLSIFRILSSNDRPPYATVRFKKSKATKFPDLVIDMDNIPDADQRLLYSYYSHPASSGNLSLLTYFILTKLRKRDNFTIHYHLTKKNKIRLTLVKIN